MKGKVYSARRRLANLVTRAEKLGVNLNDSASAALLRQACGHSELTASVSLLILGLGLLAFVLPFTVCHRYLRSGPSHCPPSRIQELHIETLSWRLPRDEGAESQGYRERLSAVLAEPQGYRESPRQETRDWSGESLPRVLAEATDWRRLSGNSSWLGLDDCEDLDRYYEKIGH